MGHRISAFVAALTLSLSIAVAPVAAEPIHDAAKAGDAAKVKKLLASGVKVDARSFLGGYTPLHLAGTAEVAEVLLKAGAKVNARDEKGWTPLHCAVIFFDETGVVEFLLSAGANGKARDKGGKTPFDWAKNHATLKGTDAYWLLNEAQYD